MKNITKSAVVNIKTDPKTKERAKKVADALGISLSSLVNAYFKNLIRTKEVHFSANPKEEPNDFMIQALKDAEEDVRAGRISPVFNNAKAAAKWLKKETKKYAN